MFNIFPEHYNLTELTGPRAQQFEKREDAFQQLVGDALKEIGGHRVYVSPTKNQDGSIDIYVTGEFILDEPFQGLTFPIIVECKDHDDRLPSVRKNITTGWNVVKKKLRNRAKQGWNDLFLPWKETKSYVYCISAMTNTQTRIDLKNKINTFFDDLTKEQKLSLQHVRVLDWNDLRTLFNQLPRLIDKWMGVHLENIISLEIYISRLSGFKEYLKKSKLEFVAPSPNNPCHPDQILNHLSQTNDKSGVLIVGASGVGKTRTVLEVSQRAAREGWRVLFILPNEPNVTAEDLAEVVLPYQRKTLLVFDYLDQMHNMDLGTLHRSLIPQSKERGIHLALLANTRPKWMMKSYPERDALFDRLDLEPSKGQKKKIITKMIEFAAPQATETLGRERVIHLCGQRPIIALLIAKELERRAKEDRLDLRNIQHLRTGDLMYWLQRRLKEDDIYVEQSETIWAPNRPKPYIVAACAALACAPDAPENLIFAAESSLEILGYDYPDHAGQIVQTLIVLGWLESDDRWLHTAHDVVADEVLDQVVFDKKSIREQELEAVLSCSIQYLRSLGRFATALNRVLGSKEGEAAENLQKASENWLKKNASALGQLAKKTDADIASYALGAVIDGLPWSETAIQTWEDFISPWLDFHGQKLVARHLLYKGLKNITKVSTSIAILKTSIKWLHENAEHILASFVLSPLLAHTDLGDNAEKSIELALEWLKKHYLSVDAGYVFRSLLARTELGNNAEKSIELALEWLKKYNLSVDAEYVFRSLLARTELGNNAEKSIELALEWLKKYNLSVDASYVFRSLLARTELGNNAEKSIELALEWLKKYYLLVDAQYVLHSLLARTDLGDHAEKSIELALLWLDKHHEILDAVFVLSSLLSRTDLEEHIEKVIQFALLWLETKDFFQSTDAVFVLKHLLQKEQLPEDQKHQLIHISLGRLQKNLRSDEATFLIRSCMKSRLNDEDLEKELFETAIQWINTHQDHSEADYVFNRLLRRPRLNDQNWTCVAQIALKWLRSTPKDHPARDYTISSLHRRCVTLLDPADFEYLINETINLLKENKKNHSDLRGLLQSVKQTFHYMNTHHPCYQWIKEFLYSIPNPFKYHLQLLIDYVENPDVPIETKVVRNALHEFQIQTEKSPSSAGYMIPALLSIAVGLENELADEIRKIVYQTISDKRYKDNQKRGMLRACLQMIEAGKFSPKEKALQLLSDMGLELKV